MIRCKVCGDQTEDDGYGEPVHKDTGLYGVYFLGDPKHGQLSHVATVNDRHEVTRQSL